MSNLIIDDSNYQNHLDFKQRGKGLVPRDWEKVTYGSQFHTFEEYEAKGTIKLIPRDQWPDLIADGHRNKTHLSYIIKDSPIKIKDQKSTNYCHANSPAWAMEVDRLIRGQNYIELSPGSIGGPVTGYRNQGAWIGDALKQTINGGAASTEFVPLNQISRTGWKPGAEENALLHQVTDWFELQRRNFDMLMSLLLQKFIVCTAHNWWRHAVTAVDPFMDRNGKFGWDGVNSWGEGYGNKGWFTLMEGKGTPDEAYAIAQSEFSDV